MRCCVCGKDGGIGYQDDYCKDGSHHKACPECGLCIQCGDCRCEVKDE